MARYGRLPGYWRVYLWYQANNLLDLKVSNERRAEVRSGVTMNFANNDVCQSTVNRSTMVWLKWIGNMQIYLGRYNKKFNGIL